MGKSPPSFVSGQQFIGKWISKGRVLQSYSELQFSPAKQNAILGQPVAYL
jgi:hypothetical protein